MKQITSATTKIGKTIKDLGPFMDRRPLLGCLLTGNGKQITILTYESWRRQSYATYENFVMISEEMGEEAILNLQEKGYDQQFFVGDTSFLAKTYIAYTKYLATGEALDGDVEAIPTHAPSWYLDDVAGEIRSDWEKQAEIFLATPKQVR